MIKQTQKTFMNRKYPGSETNLPCKGNSSVCFYSMSMSSADRPILNNLSDDDYRENHSLSKKAAAKDAPLVSVIIPTYNRKKMLIESVHSVLLQSHPHIEVIIVDDGSTDGTEDLIQEEFPDEKRIKFHRNEKNLGAGQSRKRGYQLSQGEFMVFLDDDDLYVDIDFFSKAIEKHQEYEDLTFVCAHAYLEDIRTGKRKVHRLNFKDGLHSRKYLQGFQTIYQKPYFFAAVFRRSYLDQAGLIDMEMVNDGPVFLRSLLFGRVWALSDKVGVYRFHGENISFGLTPTFITDNLEEKIKVGEKAKERSLLDDPEQWLIEQIVLTLRYFIYDSKPKEEAVKKVLDWNRKRNTGKVQKSVEKAIRRLWLRRRISKRLQFLKTWSKR